MKQLIDFFIIILDFSFEIPFDFITNQNLKVSVFGILITFIVISFSVFLINRLYK